MPVFRDYSHTNWTAENGLLGSEGVTVPAFLRRVHAQSGFDRALGECNAITSLGFGHRELTFGSGSGIGLRSFPQARFWPITEQFCSHKEVSQE